MMRKTMAILFMMAVAGSSFAANRPVGRPAPADIEVPENISYEVYSYRQGDHPRAGQIGIAVARKHLEDKTTKLPVVIFIHGGGWKNGDKDQAAWQCIRYARDGYVAVTVSYRLIHEAPFPACILDVMEAIRYVKSLQAQLPIDPENIGLQGYSAGAHLALMAALAGDNAAFHSGAYPEYDCSVKCVFAVSAPTDFVERRRREGPLKMLNPQQNEDPAFIGSISPLSYVHAGQVPVLMLHGTADRAVPRFHYENFQEKCKRAGVENFRLLTHPEGNHTFFFKEGETYQPVMKDFFDRNLKGHKRDS